jgi:hypothetical protein
MAIGIHEQHPEWHIDDIRVSRAVDFSFYPNTPTYHVVEVFTADEDDRNPLGPVIIWLGLFKEGNFVRLTTRAETAIYLKQFSRRR